MTKHPTPKDNAKNARTLLSALQDAGVDLRDEPGTPGKLWRALAASSREGLTAEFLAEIQGRSEMRAEIAAVGARFDATGEQNPADLAFLLLGLFCESTGDSFDMAGDLLAVLHAKRAGRAASEADDTLAARLDDYLQRQRRSCEVAGDSGKTVRGR